MSATEVALAAGVTPKTIYSYEAGEFAPSDAIRLKIATKIGVPASDIFDYDDALERT